MRWRWLLATSAVLVACGDNAPVVGGDTGVAGDGADGPTGDGPTGDGPVGDGQPPGDGATMDDATTDATPGDGATGDGATGDGATGDGATTDDATTDGATMDGATMDGATMDGATMDGAAMDAGDRCIPESTRICYGGPAGTIGMGICRGGTQTCSRDGTWSMCTGEVRPAAEETCGNRLDDNCNGVSDEGCGECTAAQTRTCYTGAPETRDVGRCRGGMQTCDAMGRWPMACMGETLPAMAETCGNSVDDDCNGMVDDGCGDCTPGMTRVCFTGPMSARGVGRCADGMQTCGADRRWPTACAGETLPAMAETCGNGADDDCDGMADEGCTECMAGTTRPCYTGPSGTLNAGRCRGGTQVCNAMGAYDRACLGETVPAMSETCGNMVDDDCDGMTDEGCGECMPGATRTCYTGPTGTNGTGRCRGGTQVCGPTGAFETTCLGQVTPAMAETCGNSVDDDCNGMVDDGCGDCSPGQTRPCYTGPSGTERMGICRAGTQTCGSDRRWPSTCAGETVPRSELCNTMDDDCDGMTDEAPAATACMLANATATCTAGACAVGTCNAGFANCDNTTSNGCETELATSASHCGACGRACAPGQSCVAGACSGAAGADIAAGDDFSCAVLPTGGLACWGLNGAGQLGIGSTIGRAHPTVVPQAANVADVELGTNHGCAVRTSGEVLCWGANNSGQLGDGTVVARSTAGPVFGMSDAAAVALGANHTCVRRRSGRVACWGRNTESQLGDGGTANRTIPMDVTGLTDVVEVSAGSNHTCALRLDGRVSCWGLNNVGQLGDGTVTTRARPTEVTGLTDVVSLAAGWSHTCAIRRDGTVRCWGSNTSGQVGDGTATNRLVPTAIPTITDAVQVTAGRGHTCARRRGATMMCWGANNLGQVGDGSVSTRLLPVALTDPTGVARIVAGNNHTCVRLTSGEVHCWGGNGSGSLGDGSQTNRNRVGPAVFGLLGAMPCMGTACVGPLAAGVDHACVVRPSGQLACWGANTVGSLGDGTTSNRYGPVVAHPVLVPDARRIAAGQSHTCVVLSGGGMRCWGQGNNGQLGNASTVNSLTPVTPFGITDATDVAAGFSHTCALRRGGAVVCWGANNNGQLGDASTTNRTVPTPAGGASPITDATAIDAHNNTTCAIRAGGALWCWGNNASGQLGDTTVTNRASPTQVRGVGGTGTLTGVTQVAVGTNHVCALRMGSILCWGYNLYGQLGNGSSTNRTSPTAVPTITDAVEISAGANHTCARRATGSVMCWGYNANGALGDGSLTGRALPVTVADLTGAESLVSGDYFNCSRRANGEVFCWGASNVGQVGYGWITNAVRATGPIFGLP